MKVSYKGFLVFAISLFVLLLNLDKPAIYILDEAKNAECAREMYVSGNYIVPMFNGDLRTDKPPLHYFFMVAAYKIFGVSSFSARFFSAVFGALTILITFLFTRRFQGNRAGWLAALALLASLHYNLQMRLAVPDPYLIFWMSAGFMCFYLFYEERRKAWLWLMYISFSLGFLTKGPVAIGLPGLIILIFLLVRREFNWKLIRSLYLPVGVLILLLVCFPWYWENYRQTNGEWTEGFFLKHNLERYTGTMEGHGGFFLFPLLMVIVGMFPLAIVGVQSFAAAWKKRADSSLLYGLFVALGIILFFTFSKTKLPNYTAPAYPFVGFLLGSVLAAMERDKRKMPAFGASLMFYTLIALAIPVGVYFGMKADPSYTKLAGLSVYFILLPVSAAAAWILYRRRAYGPLVLTISGAFIVTNFLFFSRAYPQTYAHNPVSESLPLLVNKKDLVYYKIFNPAYVFQMQRIIPGVENLQALQEYLKEHPKACIITRKDYGPELEHNSSLKKVFEMRDTFEKPVTVIYQAQ